MIFKNYSNMTYITPSELEKLNFIKKEEYIKEIVLSYDFDDDPGDFSLNGIYIKSQNFFYPAAAGFDIGCGFNFSHMKNTNFDLDKISKDFVLMNIENIDKTLKNPNIDSDLPAEVELGFLTKGSHFVEVKRVVHIYDHQFAQKNNIELGDFCLLVHNGINPCFKDVFYNYFVYFIKEFNKNIDEDEENGYVVSVPCNHNISKKYFADSDFALKTAFLNRNVIRSSMTKCINAEYNFSIDSAHQSIIKKGNSIEHSKGCQPYSELNGDSIAYVAVDGRLNDFIVMKNSSENIINHGICYEQLLKDPKRFYNQLDKEQLPYKKVIELETIKSIRS